MRNQALLDEAARALDALSARARADFLTLWEGASSQADLVRLVDDWFPALVERYGTIAAGLAGEVFSAAAAEMGIPANVQLASGADLGPAAARGRWAAATLSPAGNFGTLLDELVKQPYRDTMAASAVASGIGWARVPSGPATCAFCLMLASRGAVYTTRRTAAAGRLGNSYHGHCDCRVVPVRGPADYPPGYDPDSLYRDYLEARAEAGSGDPKTILAELRRANRSH